LKGTSYDLKLLCTFVTKRFVHMGHIFLLSTLSLEVEVGLMEVVRCLYKSWIHDSYRSLRTVLREMFGEMSQEIVGERNIWRLSGLRISLGKWPGNVRITPDIIPFQNMTDKSSLVSYISVSPAATMTDAITRCWNKS